ncbi:MAG TPA: VCBS repeat-containing protein, partial [Chthoniobacteraceae bacterium]|nr:VCBS repeat-containing protein [Chthoniobacteraceae bacterium]
PAPSTPHVATLSAPAVPTTFPPVDGLTLTADGTASHFTLSSFVSQIPVNRFGPLGIAFPVAGGVLVANDEGKIFQFANDVDGQTASDGTVASNFDVENAFGLAMIGNKIYLGRGNDGDIVELNQDGTFKQEIVTGLSFPLGLVADPANGHLLVAAGDTIFEVDPVAKTSTSFISASADGLAITADGKTLYAAVGDDVIGFSTKSGRKVFDSGPISRVDGTAVGAGKLSGFLFANTNFGEVWQVDLKHPGKNTLIASGGSRGDFVTADPNDGSLLLTQTDEVVRLIPPRGSFFGSGETVVVGAGTGSQVQVLKSDGSVVDSFDAFEAGFNGGVRVATGDVTGDGIADIIAGAGSGGRGRVRIFDGTQLNGQPSPIVDFRPFGAGYLGGVYVAAGDVSDDGHADLIVSTSAGSRSEVRVFDIYDALQNSQAPILLADFRVFMKVNGGVRVAAGDLDGDGLADIVVTNGVNDDVQVFHGDGTPFTGALANFHAFDGKAHGLSAAVGDIDGDKANDLVFGTASGAAKVRTIAVTGGGTVRGTPFEFTAFPGTAGVHVSVDKLGNVLAAPGAGGSPMLHVFDGTTGEDFLQITPHGSGFSGGIFLG